MRKELIKSLGREWKVAVEEEVKQLKQSDRLLLGDVAAVFARSDSFLGRPENECNEDNEAFYAVFYPSKYSLVINKNFGSVANKNSKWKLISLNEFIEQVLEFNFTYLQLLYNGASLYESEDIKKLRDEVDDLVNNSDQHTRFLRKNVSLLYGVLSDFNKGKFRNEQYIKDRVFLVLRVMKLIDDFEKTGKIELTNSIDVLEYNKMVRNGLYEGKLKDTILWELNRRTANYSSRLELTNIRHIDKDELRCFKSITEYVLLRDKVLEILKEE